MVALIVTGVVTLPFAGCDAPPAKEESGGTATEAMSDSLGQPMGPISSRIVRDNAPIDTQMHLLARVEVQPDELLEFYEPHPGTIAVSGAGAPKNGLMFRDQRPSTVEALWRMAARGAAMPAKLTAALTRARAAGGTQEVNLLPVGAGQGSASPSDDVAAPATRARQKQVNALGEEGVQLAVPAQPRNETAGWCDSPTGFWASSDSLCPFSTVAFASCRDYKTNSMWAQYAPTTSMRAGVCPLNGSLQLVLQTYNTSTGLLIGDWRQPVNANTIRWWWWTNIPGRPLARASVEQASGVTFHWRAGFWVVNPANIWEQ